MARSRSASPASSSVGTEPQARNISRLPSIAIMPQPVRRSPGSMPRMRIGRPISAVDSAGVGLRVCCSVHYGPPSRVQLLHERVGHLDIGGNILHVVLIFEAFDQLY